MGVFRAVFAGFVLGFAGPVLVSSAHPGIGPGGESTVDTLTATLRVPERVAAGETVPILFVVENADSSGAVLYVTGRPPALDVIVEDAAGRVVWRRLEGETVSMVLQVVELRPGERREFQTEWDQHTAGGEPAPPGLYRVRGSLLTEGGRSLDAPALALRIEGR